MLAIPITRVFSIGPFETRARMSRLMSCLLLYTMEVFSSAIFYRNLTVGHYINIPFFYGKVTRLVIYTTAGRMVLPPQGFSTPTIHEVVYKLLTNWIKEREAAGLPTYSGPEVIERLILNFLVEVDNNRQAKNILEGFTKLDQAFTKSASKLNQDN